MAKQTETPKADSKLEAATRVLVRMQGMGKQHARRFLGRCTAAELDKIAGCDCDQVDCGREVGDRFRSELGQVMDEVVKRQEADEERRKNKADE